MTIPPGRAGDVVVVGSVNADYVLLVERRPGPGETVGDAQLSVLPGGKGANQAVAAAACGAAVELVGLVGDDDAGARRLHDLAAAGVGTSFVARSAAAPTGSAFVVLTPDGENSIVVAPGANAELGTPEVERAAAALAAARILVAQLEVPLPAVRRAAELAAGAALVLNAAPARSLPPELLARTAVLVVNELEATVLTGRPVHGMDDAAVAAAALHEGGAAAVVVTLGAAGALLLEPSGATRVAAPRVEVRDTTGAGDAFVGALAACLAAGGDLAGAVAAGVAVGSATAGRLGTAAVVPPGWWARASGGATAGGRSDQAVPDPPAGEGGAGC